MGTRGARHGQERGLRRTDRGTRKRTVVETVGPERDHEESAIIGERTQTVDPCVGRGETDHSLGDTEMGSVQGSGIQTGGWRALLDEVWQDLEDLRGVGDHGDDLHGLVASRAAPGGSRRLAPAAAWEVRFVDLLDQAGPASRRFLRNGCRPWGGEALFGGYGQLGLRLLGWTDAEGWLGWMVALPALGSQTDQVGLAGPPFRRASAPVGRGVPRAREEYRPQVRMSRRRESGRCWRSSTRNSTAGKSFVSVWK
jgi:hypothetical protein